MKINFIKLTLFCLALAFGFSLTAAAQTQQFKTDSAKADSPRVIKAKREIIRLLFADIFRGEAKENIYLSTKNIPAEIQEDFPEFENLTARFADPALTGGENCPFVFHDFSVSGRKAVVSFGNCRDGLGYNFVKIKGKWHFAAPEIKRK